MRTLLREKRGKGKVEKGGKGKERKGKAKKHCVTPPLLPVQFVHKCPPCLLSVAANIPNGLRKIEALNMLKITGDHSSWKNSFPYNCPIVSLMTFSFLYQSLSINQEGGTGIANSYTGYENS